MLKKMVVLAVVGFVAVSALSGTKIMSYIRSEWKAAQQEAEDNIPPEKEIARLKNEIALLDGDIKKVINALAKERVEVNQLKDKIDDMAAKQAKDDKNLKDRGQAIKDAEAASPDGTQTVAKVQFGARKIGLAEAKAELKEGVKRYNANQKALDAHNVLLANRIKARDTLEKQLEAMKNQKDELKAAVDTLETELQMLKLQQIESKYQNDDSRMDKIKKDIQKLKTRMDVKREELKLMPSALDDTPVKTEGAGDESVDDILAGKAGSKKTD